MLVDAVRFDLGIEGGLRNAEFCGGEGLFPFNVGDEVGGAELVVGAPTAPILHLIKELIEFFGIVREAGRRGTR